MGFQTNEASFGIDNNVPATEIRKDMVGHRYTYTIQTKYSIKNLK